MTFRERMEKRFGSPLPGYIERVVKMREAGTARRARQQREARDRKEAKYARIRALRRPPQNVRIVGRKVFFEPPETADQLRFAGFWVSEFRNGAWTKHGDFHLPHEREAVLFGSDDGSVGPVRVETWYNQMKLHESYPSPVVHAEAA